MYGTARRAHFVVGFVMEKERETLPGLVNVLGDAFMVKPVELTGGQELFTPHPVSHVVPFQYVPAGQFVDTQTSG